MVESLLSYEQQIARMFVEYTPLVKRIAYHILTRLPASTQLDDLVQAGMIGLLEAYRHYDHKKGASFETYAGIRVRGSILDEMRRNDWLPRSVHRNSRRVSNAVRSIEHQTGRDARDVEVAKLLDVSLEEYHQMVLDGTGGKIFGLDDIAINEDIIFEHALSSPLPLPTDALKFEQFKTYLLRGIDNLPERERTVLLMYYDEEKNLKEIGHILGITESRVCQIHGQAMIRLKNALQLCLN